MPNPVSAADLATARAAVQSLMIDSVIIKRQTVAKSDTGGNKPTDSTVATTVCRKLDLYMHPKIAVELLSSQLDPVKLTELALNTRLISNTAPAQSSPALSWCQRLKQ